MVNMFWLLLGTMLRMFHARRALLVENFKTEPPRRAGSCLVISPTTFPKHLWNDRVGYWTATFPPCEPVGLKWMGNDNPRRYTRA